MDSRDSIVMCISQLGAGLEGILVALGLSAHAVGVLGGLC